MRNGFFHPLFSPPFLAQSFVKFSWTAREREKNGEQDSQNGCGPIFGFRDVSQELSRSYQSILSPWWMRRGDDPSPPFALGSFCSSHYVSHDFWDGDAGWGAILKTICENCLSCPGLNFSGIVEIASHPDDIQIVHNDTHVSSCSSVMNVEDYWARRNVLQPTKFLNS